MLPVRVIQAIAQLTDPGDPPAATVQYARFHVAARVSIVPLAGVDQGVTALGEDLLAESPQRIRGEIGVREKLVSVQNGTRKSISCFWNLG